MPVDSALHVLTVKQEIRDALSRYCRAMDRRDEGLAAAVWHPDGQADYGPDIFQGTGAGFATWVTNVHAGLDRHSHQITNVLVEVAGDRAVSEAYVTVVLRGLSDSEGGVSQITTRGRYLDQWEQRDGRWAVTHRQFVDDITGYEQLSAAEAGARNEVGSRDRHDPSYALFNQL